MCLAHKVEIPMFYNYAKNICFLLSLYISQKIMMFVSDFFDRITKYAFDASCKSRTLVSIMVWSFSWVVYINLLKNPVFHIITKCLRLTPTKEGLISILVPRCIWCFQMKLFFHFWTFVFCLADTSSSVWKNPPWNWQFSRLQISLRVIPDMFCGIVPEKLILNSKGTTPFADAVMLLIGKWVVKTHISNNLSSRVANVHWKADN